MGSMTGSAAENKGSTLGALNMPKTWLRMNRNRVCLADNLCFAFAKHGRLKVPIQKLSPSQSIKTAAKNRPEGRLVDRFRLRMI